MNPAQTSPSPAATDRRVTLADAALRLLVDRGGRGLTHRAADREAGLPEGSTSNYFPTREALLTAALHRLVELERPSVVALEALVPQGPFAPHRAAELLAEVVAGWLAPERANLAVARYELFLEARRRPVFKAAFGEVRGEYLELTEQLLPASGCSDAHRHAPQLLALLDGLVLNQLLQPVTELSEADLVDSLERFFERC